MLSSLRQRTEFLHFASEEIAAWTLEHVRTCPADRVPRVLDVGLGSGRDLKTIRDLLQPRPVELFGVESKPHAIEAAKREGIAAFPIDIESDSIPMPDGFFDVVIANHVIEHLKELFWFFGEVRRVLRPNGVAIIGCPNLASWHNRAALVLGVQPPGAKALGPHVRGITMRGFEEFIEYGGYFKVTRRKGSNFYFLPVTFNRVMEKIAPSLCASMHFMINRTQVPGSFLDVLDSPIPGIVDTPYRRGARSI